MAREIWKLCYIEKRNKYWLRLIVLFDHYAKYNSISINLMSECLNSSLVNYHLPHHIYFYNHPSGYIKSHEIILNPPILVQHHRVHSSVSLLSLFAIPFFSTEIPGSVTTVIYSFA